MRVRRKQRPAVRLKDPVGRGATRQKLALPRLAAEVGALTSSWVMKRKANKNSGTDLLAPLLKDRDDLSAEETHEPQTLQRPHHHRRIQQALRPATRRT